MPAIRHRYLFLASLLLASAAHAQVYTCTTDSGKKITADRPIAECADRDQRELQTKTGRVTIVPPRQTDAERYAQEEAARKAAQQRAQEAQQQRNDQLLLVRYPDDASLETQRSYYLDEAKKRFLPTLSEEAGIDKRRTELRLSAQQRAQAGKSIDFADTKEAAQLERRAMQLQPVLDKYTEQVAKINTKMDADLKRLHELQAQLKNAQSTTGKTATSNASAPATKAAQSPSH